MTEQQKKKRLVELESHYRELYRKKRRYQFQLDSIQKRIDEILKEIEEL